MAVDRRDGIIENNATMTTRQAPTGRSNFDGYMLSTRIIREIVVFVYGLEK